MMPELEKQALLRDILKSSEEILRAYDLKTEVAMICFVLSVEAIHAFVDLSRLKVMRPGLTLILFLLFLLAMVSYLSVLLPVYKNRPGDPDHYSGTNVFFITDPNNVSPGSYLRTLDAIDQRSEMAHQIMLLSEIRNVKHQRFLIALYVTFAFYAVTLLSGMLGIMKP